MPALTNQPFLAFGKLGPVQRAPDVPVVSWDSSPACWARMCWRQQVKHTQFRHLFPHIRELCMVQGHIEPLLKSCVTPKA